MKLNFVYSICVVGHATKMDSPACNLMTLMLTELKQTTCEPKFPFKPL